MRSGPGGRAEDSFASAYRDLFLPAFRLAHRMTDDRSLAEDLAAEAMARAYARWSSVSRLDSPLAWVLRVTTNLAVDAVRRQKVAQRSLPKLALPDVGGQFEESSAARLSLVAAMSCLPRRQRAAVALYYLGGLSEEDVARSLDITTSSVRTHLQRGLAALRKRMDSNGEVAHVPA